MGSTGQRSQHSAAMIFKVSKEQAALRRQAYLTPGGAQTHVSTYIGTNAMELAAQGKPQNHVADRTSTSPMAYLVEQSANSTVEPHFHQVDQFQIFIGGSGHIGTHSLDGVTVHYSGAHSPYGPIVAGPAGVQYVTLRRNWDPGAQWMPGAAAALRGMPGRKHVAFTSDPWMRSPAEQNSHLKSPLVTEMIPSQANGLGAWLVRAGPDAVLHGNPAESNGVFWYVLSGGLQPDDSAPGASMGTGACIFFSHDEQPFQFRAAAQGVELIQVRFALD